MVMPWTASCVLCLAVGSDPSWMPAPATPGVSGPTVAWASGAGGDVASPQAASWAFRPVSLRDDTVWRSLNNRPATGGVARQSRKPAWWPRLFQRDRRPEQAPSLEPAPLDLPPPRRTLAAPLFRRQPEPPSDSMLQSRCRALFQNDSELSRCAIHVSASEGVLQLYGTVQNDALRDKAERVARKTEGACGVSSDLTVAGVPQGWFSRNPVTLGAPQPAQAMEQAPALASVNSYWASRAPVQQPTSAWPPAVPSAPSAEVSANAWQPVPQSAGGVAGAPPSSPRLVLASREGMPEVVTYLVRRPIAPSPSRPLELATASLRADQALGLAVPAGAALPPPVPPQPAQEPANQPGVLGSASGVHADIDSVLARDPRATLLTYRLDKGELVLSGEIRSPGDLYDLTAELGELPGVEVLSFESVKITN